jgi:hypothetical protein
MSHPPRKADSLDRVEILMALEGQHPELGSAFETLWKLDPDFDEGTVAPLRPYIVSPFQATAVRGGMVTHVTVFARFGDRAMGLDHDCSQVAIGTLIAGRELNEVRHYRTLEMASRALLSESGHSVASGTSLERTRER